MKGDGQGVSNPGALWRFGARNQIKAGWHTAGRVSRRSLGARRTETNTERRLAAEATSINHRERTVLDLRACSTATAVIRVEIIPVGERHGKRQYHPLTFPLRVRFPLEHGADFGQVSHARLSIEGEETAVCAAPDCCALHPRRVPQWGGNP